ncbi:glutathione S-transferase N-terminal domain-containing protein [Burkholderia gladioli]|uniref:glutathione S-transferase N-terminal domain-containing protein n=1 Tax=Burkholderia gladioli TaxID=28095 RepID=UPI001ABB3850|nr:glutathione S-transferase N-terminal domain-containing protein [Burkholderia gladioli]MDN7752766.1 glutathione S-transferase N-terminal domain-containing protein [Burkholderia gladioli]URV25903.1 glutathione S-transferase N-terminal domain-containing protein [Burkholderia gladioli]
MTETFKPIVYLKQSCPFCMKIRLFILEAALGAEVETRDFASGTPQEEAIRAELAPHLNKVSFPAAQIQPGQFIAESDDIIAALAQKSGRNPAVMPVYQNYVDGPLAALMRLWKENMNLKKVTATT